MSRGFLVRRYLEQSYTLLDLTYLPAPLDLSLKTGPITPPPTPTSETLTTINVPPKKHRVIRKLSFDVDTTSPVSGTLIKEPDGPLAIRKGDIDPAYNVVEATEEAKAELAKIENRIGDYVCRLCKELYDDPFGLARHRCSRIVHVEYKCPECDKVFNCPANLASHRRWHKPRTEVKADQQEEGQWACGACGKCFKKQAYLKKHMTTHQPTPLFYNANLNFTPSRVPRVSSSTDCTAVAR